MESQTNSSQNHKPAAPDASPDDLGNIFLGAPFEHPGAEVVQPLGAETPGLLPTGEVAPPPLAPTVETEASKAQAKADEKSPWRNVATASAAVSAAYLGQRGLNTEAVAAQGEHIVRKAGEVLSYSKNSSMVAFAGIRRARAARKRDNLRASAWDHEMEAAVKSEGVQAILGARYPDPELKPVTMGERRTVDRASRRRHKSKRREGDMFFESKVYDDSANDRPTLEQELATTRYSRSEKRARRSHGRRFRHNDSYVNRVYGRVEKVASGNIRPRRQMLREESRADELDNRVTELDQARASRLARRAYNQRPGPLKRVAHATRKHTVTASKAVGRKVTIPFKSIYESYDAGRIDSLKGQIARLETEARFHDSGNNAANEPTGKDLSKKAARKRKKAYDLGRDLTYAEQQAADRRAARP